MINIQESWQKIVEENDQKAFSVFFDHYYPRLFSFCLQYVKLPSGAEEVVSDVIFNLLKDEKKLKNIEKINAYLYKSVKNKSLSWLRDQKKNLKIESIEQAEDYIIDESDSTVILSYDQDINELLEGAVSKLPAQRQMVYRLVREDGLLMEEVAELLALSKRTIEKHLELAIKELCQHLKVYLQDQRQHPKIRKFFPRSFISIFI
ncbi:MAG: RNA polymerase sigma-70 factor [Cyclobacteriaceae bacterium]|nr:RNA polymerase sigma-70 factor [Cyclobacteriaceae bacterium]